MFFVVLSVLGLRFLLFWFQLCFVFWKVNSSPTAFVFVANGFATPPSLTCSRLMMDRPLSSRPSLQNKLDPRYHIGFHLVQGPLCRSDRSARGIEPAFCKFFFSSFFDRLVAAAVMCVFDYFRVHTLFIQISNTLILASLDCFSVSFWNGLMSASIGSRCLQVEGGWNVTSEA